MKKKYDPKQVLANVAKVFPSEYEGDTLVIWHGIKYIKIEPAFLEKKQLNEEQVIELVKNIQKGG